MKWKRSCLVASHGRFDEPMVETRVLDHVTALEQFLLSADWPLDAAVPGGNGAPRSRGFKEISTKASFMTGGGFEMRTDDEGSRQVDYSC
jgi:hypothetical protein